VHNQTYNKVVAKKLRQTHFSSNEEREKLIEDNVQSETDVAR